MKCAHCQKPKARHRWAVQACADGRKKRSRWLCDEHDIALNRMVLTFLGDGAANAKLAAYEAKVKA